MTSRLATLLLLLGTYAAQAQSVTIQEAGGWLETAYLKWGAVAGAQRYNVYYTGGGVTDKKIDDPLIRQYGSTIRADIPGLKAGSYTMKVAAVVGGKEGQATTSTPVTVQAHDRTGFAFSGGRIPGAYNLDGTPMTGAVVVYVTEKSKDTVSLTVTGASANPCVGIQNILYAIKKGKDARPFIIRVVGQVTDAAVLEGGDLVIENNNLATGHLTLEGVGEDALADGWGIRLKSASNIEVRNLGIMNVNSTAGDDIGLQQDNDHVWIHHNDHFYGDAGSDADQVKGDGAMDVKLSTYVTIAYDHFWDNGKSSLLGLSENTTSGLYIDYHHNWFDHSDSRHPRVRFYSAHVYNNYYDGNDKYGAGSTMGSSIFMEANYFRKCKYPMLTSLQGSDVWDETKKADVPANGTFSGEAGGSIKAWNNVMEGQARFVPYGSASYPNSKVDFDAYVATSRTEKVPSSVTSFSGANTYNNFDTDVSVMYTYTPDAPEAARTKVVAASGRMHGGDFKWTFTAADDTTALVNTGLKAAIVGYKTTLLRIQGEGSFLTVGTLSRAAAPASVIRFDAGNDRLVVPEGTTLRTVQVVGLDGSVIPATDNSFAGLRPGLYVVRVSTDRGQTDLRVLKTR